MTTSEVATVLAWNDALCGADIDTLVQLSSDDIDISDSKGAIQGHQALRQWAENLKPHWQLGRMYVHHGVVAAELFDSDNDAAAVVFRVVRDQVTAVFWHSDLAEALTATELTQDDQVD